MNKKEVTEIKKNFNEDCGFFTMNKVLITMVSGDGDILFTKRPTMFSMTERELDMYYTMLRNVLSTKVGRNLIQYTFKDDDDGKTARGKLFAAVLTNLNEDNAMADYVNHIVDSVVYSGPYAVITAHCTYTVRHKHKDDTINDDSNEDYNFIIAAFCPANTVDSGFSFNNATGDFSTESDPKLYISKKPTDGFIYPAFNNRTSDVNSIMYYTKSPKDMNTSIVEFTLGATYTMSPVQETDTFNYLITQTFGDDTNYQLIYMLNEKLNAQYDAYKDDSDPVLVGVNEISTMLESIGVEPADVEKFRNMYSLFCDGMTFNVVNLICKNIKFKTTEGSISINSGFGDKVSPVVVDGAKSIKVSTDDTKVVVNDIPVTLK